MYDYIVPQQLDIADRLGPFTFIQWGIISSGGLLVMFMFMSSLHTAITIVLGVPILALCFFLALVKRHGMPIYQFMMVYFLFMMQPKEMIYGTGMSEESNLDDEEYVEVNFY